MRARPGIGGMLLCVLALFVSQQFLSPSASRGESEAFADVATRALAAVTESDWTALKRISASQLVFAQYMRGYTSQESKQNDEVL